MATHYGVLRFESGSLIAYLIVNRVILSDLGPGSAICVLYKIIGCVSSAVLMLSDNISPQPWRRRSFFV